jgi:hypothetical protein
MATEDLMGLVDALSAEGIQVVPSMPREISSMTTGDFNRPVALILPEGMELDEGLALTLALGVKYGLVPNEPERKPASPDGEVVYVGGIGWRA